MPRYSTSYIPTPAEITKMVSALAGTETFGDNLTIDVRHSNELFFRFVLAMALAHAEATRYSIEGPFPPIEGDGGIAGPAHDPVLERVGDPLPYKMGPDDLVDFAWRWVKQATMPPKLDIDGDHQRGWRIQSQDDGYQYAIVSIETEWILLGK